jgi:glycosyltransferase involved in cell wall biosynthesis
MPAFNVAPFIADAVASVLAQSLPDLELIVVDDGSEDGTLGRLDEFDDPRLRVVAQANSGSSAARNAGIRLASGQYVAFIDGDDLWRKEKLRRQVELLEAHPDVDLTFSRSEIVDESGRPTGRASRRVSGSVSFRQLLIENLVNNGSAVVMRRDALERTGGFDTTLKACVDLDLWLRVTRLRPGNCVCLDEALTVYRMRAGQITKDWRRMEEAWLAVFAKIRALAPDDAASVAPQAHAKLYRYLGYIAYETGDYRNARMCLRRALRHSLTTSVADRRTWLLFTAVLARTLLPRRAHAVCDALARRLRASSSPVRLTV